MDLKTILNKKLLATLCCFVLVYTACNRESESEMLEKHGYEFAQSEFKDVDWTDPDIKIVGENVARSVAHDVHALQTAQATPKNKYGIETMYCNALATFAIRSAQKEMQSCENDVNAFASMKPAGMYNGNVTTAFWRATYEGTVKGSVSVIKDPANLKMSKMEKTFKKMTPGSYVRYCGHWDSGKAHAHTQMYLGQGYCDETRFVPTKHGKTVMGAGYNDAFKYLENDVRKKYRNKPEDTNLPVLDSIVIIDVPAIMMYQAKNR